MQRHIPEQVSPEHTAVRTLDPHVISFPGNTLYCGVTVISATAIASDTVTNIFRGSVALICCFTVQRSVKTAVDSH